MRAVAQFALCGVILFGSGAVGPSTAAANVADFYNGKQVRMVIGVSPGGGFDAFGRLVARHIGRHIPGHPTLVPQNLPGASGLTAVQGLAGDKEGLSIVHFNAGVILQSVTAPDKVKMDFRTIAFLGSVSSDMRVCYVWHATGIRNWDDLVQRPVINLGATSRGSASYLDSAVMRNVMGVNIKPIIGYPGTSERLLAIERGELDGDCGSFETVPQAWVKENKVVFTHRNSRSPIPGIDVPYIVDLAKTPEQKRVLSTVLIVADIFRPFVVNADIPGDRLQALRGALWATVEDREFLADAERSKRTVQNPIRGDEVQKMVEDLYATPPEMIEKSAQAIQ